MVSALVSCFSSSCEVGTLANSPTRLKEPTPTSYGSRFTRRPKFEPSCGMFLSHLVPFARFIGPLVHRGRRVDHGHDHIGWYVDSRFLGGERAPPRDLLTQRVFSRPSQDLIRYRHPRLAHHSNRIRPDAQIDIESRSTILTKKKLCLYLSSASEGKNRTGVGYLRTWGG